MNSQAQFEMKVSNLANLFLYHSLSSPPQRHLKLAERIAQDDQKLAKELLKMMDGSLYLVDLLANGILTGDYSHLEENELVDRLDKIEGHSKDMDCVSLLMLK